MTDYTTADYARAYVAKYALALVPLPPRTKRPLAKKWGHLVIQDPDKAHSHFSAHPDDNVGVALGPSRLCSLDIDDEPAFRTILAELGRNIDDLKNGSYPIIQGNAPKFRLMFRVPDAADLTYHSLTWPKQEGKGRFTVAELRASCSGEQRQDVFPPSIHPDTGQPYRWLVKPNGHFPEPPAWLLTIWREWDKFKPQLQEMCPWAPKSAPPEPRRRKPISGAQPSVIDAYNAANGIEDELTRHNYKRIGKRWLSPHSGTGLPGVVLFDDNRCFIHHASDPLCSDESGQPVGPFDLFRYYDHGGDMTKAVRAAAESLGMRGERRQDTHQAQWSEPDADGVIHEPANISEPPSDPSPPIESYADVVVPINWGSILAGSKQGPFNNLDNVVRVIGNDPHLSGRIWYDEFLDSIMTNWSGPLRKWRDADDVLLQLYVQREVGLRRVSAGVCHDAALVAAFHDIRNECKEWIESREWDGIERLNAVLIDGFGAEENSYTQAVGRCWFISMVARVLTPGCKVDTVPVFEGTQGAGKSSALRAIGGKWFTECHESVLTKDFYGVLDGHMLVEIAEMHSFTRSEVERIKGAISNQVDRYRKAYGRNTEDHPRKSVLACTTNRDDWQRDDTGARRFWPILCGAINLALLAEWRDQLFAEALVLFRSGASWWDVPVDRQKIEAENRRDADAWEPVIDSFLGLRVRCTTSELLTECLHIEIGKQTMADQKRVARAMRALGWDQSVLRESGKNVRIWNKKA